MTGGEFDDLMERCKHCGSDAFPPISVDWYKQMLIYLCGKTEQQAERIIAKLLREQAK